MFGDMSAGSGQNALTRDLEHATAFLHRHQDKLCYASDCADVEGEGEKCSGAGTSDIVRQLVPEPEVRAKIFAKNAQRVIKGLA
jgi:predicted TIM-barrel fold metal-dependent hydrolase